MEKNTLKAVALAALVLLFYPLLLNWFYPNTQRQKKVPGKEAEVSAPTTPVRAEAVPEAAVFLDEAEAPAVAFFENDLYKVEFSTLGGTITRLSFLGEKGRKELTRTDFFEGDSRVAGMLGLSVLGEKADLSQTIFKLLRGGERGEVFEFTYELPGAYLLTKTFTVHGDKPVIDLSVRVKNLEDRERNMAFSLKYAMDHEKDYQKDYGFYDGVAYAAKLKTENLDHIKKKGFSFPEGTVWAGFIKKYFALMIKPDAKIVSGNARADAESLWGTLTLEPLTVPRGGEARTRVLIYAGPQRYEALKQFGDGFESIFSRGFFGLFKMGLLMGLKFFHQFTHNYGWSLVLLTLLIKLLFAPLTHLSYASMKKMQVLSPKMKAIQEQHKKDPAKAQHELMLLYRRNKVNPMMGCLPMLIQIPVFIAMFKLLPEAIELHGAPFVGWIKDLSAPDHFLTLPFTVPMLGWNALNLLPIAMAASQVWYQKLMPAQPGSTPEQQKIMNLMPIFFGFICYNMPSGLTLYWTLQNLFSIIQQVFINRIVVVLHHEDAA
ncbi:MAG: membrane protein insertase YidC [Candidatus Omnitrophica bacterium]|nr:membrane protein insertase YidC [Candidatus Omnitrophota bacterium]